MASITLFLLPLIFAAAFVTLADRKGIGILQRRLGPDTVGVAGILQPFADALKLLLKEAIQPSTTSKTLAVVLPCLVLSCSLLGYTFVPLATAQAELDISTQVVASIILLSLAVHGILYIGWEGENSYAFIGSLRTSAQLISYELTLSAGFLVCAIYYRTINYSLMHEALIVGFSIVTVSLISPVLIVSSLAESARVPFDLPEAESEIVAGFITELSAVPFVLYFLGEYTSLLLLVTIITLILTPRLLSLTGVLLTGSAVWARAVLPRLRYDQLMELGWLILLPTATILVFGILSLER